MKRRVGKISGSFQCSKMVRRLVEEKHLGRADLPGRDSPEVG